MSLYPNCTETILTYKIHGGKLGDELCPAAVEALALQEAHAVEEGDGEEGRRRQLGRNSVGKKLEFDLNNPFMRFCFGLQHVLTPHFLNFSFNTNGI